MRDSTLVLSDSRAPKVEAARKSVFDLSDSDDSDADDAAVSKGPNVVADNAVIMQIKASMQGTEKQCPPSFHTETDRPVAAERAEDSDSEDLEAHGEEEEKEVISIVEAQRRRRIAEGVPRKKKRPRQERKTRKADAQPVEVADFDYEKYGKLTQVNSDIGDVGPMRKLRVGDKKGRRRTDGPRVKKSRKAPRSGIKSMSFMGE